MEYKIFNEACPLPSGKCRDSWHMDCWIEKDLFGGPFDDATEADLKAGLFKLQEFIATDRDLAQSSGRTYPMLFNFLHQIMHRLGEPGTAELFERMRQVADAESCEDLRRYVKEKMIAKH